jgi:YgiT-type zinc finger domain-containing protein
MVSSLEIKQASLTIDEGAEPGTCACCGGDKFHLVTSRTAFWHGDRLVIVDGIPALACDGCGERYYEDRTAMVLDLMRGRGFPAEAATAEMVVPVFAYDDFAAESSR